jgi:hypothetical protein
MRLTKAVLILILALAPAAMAQRGGSGPRGDDFGGGQGVGGAGFGRGPAENRLDRFADLMKLNKQQKAAAKEAFDAAQEEANPVRDQIQKSRIELAEALLNKKTQAEIDQLTASHGALLAQMTGIEVRAFAKVFETFTPDQQKKAAQALAFVSGMFNGRNWNGS